MALAVAILLGIIALVFVLYPLLRPVSANGIENAQEHITKLPTEQEQHARAALQEVELDYQLGNIAEADYRPLRERYMRKALVALKTRYEQDIDAKIEEELRKMKEQVKDEAE